MEYWFDAEGRIAKVGEGWLEFATENGSAGLTPESVIGLPLSSFISDPPTRLLWERFLRKAREGQAPHLTLRCDAPDRRRLVELTLSKDGDLTRVTSTLLSEEPRPRLALLESGRTEHRETIVFCSWCDKLLLPFGVWMEPEAAVEKMGYFEMSTLPAISWGICPSCLESANAGADSGAGAGETGRVPPPRT